MESGTLTALWWAVIFSGVFHGVNPGMGWPLAVSAGLMNGNRRSLATALGMLALGHLLAMLAILMPFSVMSSLFIWETELRMGAGLLVLLMGVYLLVNRKHPRFLARVHPARLALWSFLAAMAHGQNDRGCSQDNVPSGEDTLDVGLAGGFIDHNPTPTGAFKLWEIFRDQRIGAIANGHNHHINVFNKF